MALVTWVDGAFGARLCVAAVLVLSGGLKLVTPRGPSVETWRLVLPRRVKGLAESAPLVIAAVELSSAVTILTFARFPLSAAPATILFGFALVYLVALKSRAPISSCGCLGSLSRSPVTIYSFIRAGFLFLLASLSWAIETHFDGSGQPDASTGIAWAAGFIVIFVISSDELVDLIPARRRKAQGYSRSLRQVCPQAGEPADLLSGIRPMLLPLSCQRLEWLSSQQLHSHWRNGCWDFLEVLDSTGLIKATIAVDRLRRAPARIIVQEIGGAILVDQALSVAI